MSKLLLVAFSLLQAAGCAQHRTTPARGGAHRQCRAGDSGPRQRRRCQRQGALRRHPAHLCCHQRPPRGRAAARGTRRERQRAWIRSTRRRAVDMALVNGHSAVAIFLLQNGSQGADGALCSARSPATWRSSTPRSPPDCRGRRWRRRSLSPRAQSARRLCRVIKAALDARPRRAARPRRRCRSGDVSEIRGRLSRCGKRVDGHRHRRREGAHASDSGATAAAARAKGRGCLRHAPSSQTSARRSTTWRGTIDSMTIVQGPVVMTLARAESAPAPTAPSAAAPAPAPATARLRRTPAIDAGDQPRNWPSFRGDAASGNGDGQGAVTEWDVASGKNIKWKTPIPGIAQLESDCLGQSHLRDDGDQQGGRHDVPHRRVRRREAGGRSVTARVEDLLPRQGHRQSAVGARSRSRALRRRSGIPRAARRTRRRSPTAAASSPPSGRPACSWRGT